MPPNRILAFDAKTNGPSNLPFAIGAILIDSAGKEVVRFAARCPIEDDLDVQVARFVLPAMQDLPQTHTSYEHMLATFYGFCRMWGRRDTDVVTHLARPVQTTLLRDMFAACPEGDWRGPLRLFDLAVQLDVGGHDPHSVDAYNHAHRIVIPDELGPPNNPLHDAAAAAHCWRHLMARPARRPPKLAGQTIELGTETTGSRSKCSGGIATCVDTS